MKRISILLLLILGMVGAVVAADKSKAKIKFEKTTYDFGYIKEDGGPVTREFIFENEGSEPLIINSARAECGCTKPVYPKDAIAPGEKGVIKVTYNPAGRPGGFTKIVTVRCNGTPGKINLKIRGTVVPKQNNNG